MKGGWSYKLVDVSLAQWGVSRQRALKSAGENQRPRFFRSSKSLSLEHHGERSSGSHNR